MDKRTKILKEIPPYLINQDGALQEWSWPGLKDNYNHRHSSHLLMVWPYREISPEKNVILFNAAKETLKRKDQYNYENAGHGLLHSALIAAGLKNSESLTQKMLRLTKEDFYYNNLCTSHYVNHGVFCTDVANTVPTIMMEMLISSSPGTLELLPALPKSLTKGSIYGLKGRGQLTIEKMSWNTSSKRIDCIIKSGINQKITLIERAGIVRINANTKIETSPFGSIARIVRLKKGERTSISVFLENKNDSYK